MRVVPRPTQPSAASVAALLFALAAWACGGGAAPASDLAGAPACRAVKVEHVSPNASLVLVLDDTLRRDVLGCYGGEARTPRLDAFAAQAVVFEAAEAPAPWTKPSVASLFTSLYPSQHRVASDPHLAGGQREPVAADVLSEEFLTLAEVLRAAGLRTAAFVSNPWLGAENGFAQGFEVYDDSFAAWHVPGRTVSEAALAWLATLEPGERYFLYVHYIDTHRPYGKLLASDVEELAHVTPARKLGPDATNLVRKVIRREEGGPLPAEMPVAAAVVRRAYARGVERFDDAFGALLDGLEARPDWPDTALVVTSDHGESLFERGWGNHGASLYAEELAVPLVARLPGTVPRAGESDCLVSLVDLVPSFCAYLGLRPPPVTAGASFVEGPFVEQARPRRFLVSEGTMVRPSHRTIRNERYKLIHEPAGPRDPRKKKSVWSLFDLSRDPGQMHDLLERDVLPPEIQRVFGALAEELPIAVPAYAAPEKRYVPIDDAARRQLEALGYFGDDSDGDGGG